MRAIDDIHLEMPPMRLRMGFPSCESYFTGSWISVSHSSTESLFHMPSM
jgi:hypothetical protein